MGIFDFNWFKSEHKKKLERLELETAKFRKAQLENEFIEKVINLSKPYRNIKLVNNVLTIILNDGNIISKPGATELDFQRARLSNSEQELFQIASSSDGLEEQKKQEMDIKKVENLIKGVEILKNLADFDVEGNSVYLKGTKRSIPLLLVEKFAELANDGKIGGDEWVASKRFFLWCCLNPRAEVADKLYDFLTRNNMKITKQGFFIGLRNVANVSGNDHPLVDFVTNVYHKVKAVWKDTPESYSVYRRGEGYEFERCEACSSGEYIGNLSKLYLDLPNMSENRYTDGWTKTFDIRIGKVVSMRPEDCNWSTQDCATAGLHFAGHTSPYVLYGDTTVFTLHNPMKVVGIGSEKGRCWEYLPFMTTNVAEADEIMNSMEFDFLQLDEKYAIEELENLEQKVKEGLSKEVKKYEFNLPDISTLEIKNIVASLEEIKGILSNRVISLGSPKVYEMTSEDEYEEEDDDEYGYEFEDRDY